MERVREIFDRIEALGRLSEEPRRLTRTFGSAALSRAMEAVGAWMGQAGMSVRRDAMGNLIGRYPACRSGAKVLLLGSHLDTVRDAGKFDGPLGVLLALGCVEQLHSSGLRLPFAIEVVGFCDEEGVRFQSTYLGSRALAGTLKAADLKRTDAQGISLAEALRRFGGQPSRLVQARMKPSRLLGYLEAHIEQGPVLEEQNLAVGVVSGIAGATRALYRFSGQAGHAGTTPMQARRDALCAAAQFILGVEQQARASAGLVATVGQLHLEPNASNVIPGAAALTLDVRHLRDSVRLSAERRLHALARRVAAARRLTVSVQIVQRTAAVQCEARLTKLLGQAVQRHQPRRLSLPSGAGHDAAALAALTPVAMLFIRCKNGLSHHPAESVRRSDVAVALRVLEQTLQHLAQRELKNL